MLQATNKEVGNYSTLIGGLENPKEYDWNCPNCNGTAIHVKESIDGRIEHFRHKVTSNCNFEPETRRHLEMKKYFYDNLKDDENVVRIELEHKVGNRIADIYLEMKKELYTGAFSTHSNDRPCPKIAIEVQHSKISLPKLLERTEDYDKNGVWVIWVLDGDSSISKNIQYAR